MLLIIRSLANEDTTEILKQFTHIFQLLLNMFVGWVCMYYITCDILCMTTAIFYTHDLHIKVYKYSQLAITYLATSLVLELIRSVLYFQILC